MANQRVIAGHKSPRHGSDSDLTADLGDIHNRVAKLCFAHSDEKTALLEAEALVASLNLAHDDEYSLLGEVLRDEYAGDCVSDIGSLMGRFVGHQTPEIVFLWFRAIQSFFTSLAEPKVESIKRINTLIPFEEIMRFERVARDQSASVGLMRLGDPEIHKWVMTMLSDAISSGFVSPAALATMIDGVASGVSSGDRRRIVSMVTLRCSNARIAAVISGLRKPSRSDLSGESSEDYNSALVKAFEAATFYRGVAHHPSTRPMEDGACRLIETSFASHPASTSLIRQWEVPGGGKGR